MARTETTVRLSAAGIAALDRAAEEWGIRRSELIRVILGAALADRGWLARQKPKPSL